MWKDIKNKIFKKEPRVDYLIIGLGNPGEKYEKTAHNVGFRVLSLFQEEANFPVFEKDNPLNALVSKGIVENKKVVLLLPQTYMNLSGGAVQKAVKSFNIALDKLIVVHDDNDLPLNTLRFSFGQGSAGHNGVSSLLATLKNKDFYRLRIGVRERDGKAMDSVLKNNSNKTREAEKRAVEELLLSIREEFSLKTVVITQKNEE
jgi:PTH1 family peptidyl-tRNA hydrolase